MSVILIESKKAPVVSAHLWVKTGSADERAGEEGISHFIEHLVFKGTRDYKVGEIAQSIEGSGGELNAYTTFDQTVFHITISKNYSNNALKAISQMAGYPIFDEKEIDNEREVVIEEIKRSEDSPASQASRLLFESTYKNHPYGIPVIGYEKVIKSVSRKKIVNYFSKRYSPANMTLVVAGDFSISEMRKNVAQYFGNIKKTKLEIRKRKREKPQSKAKVVIKKANFEESYIYFSWKIPDIKHKDVVAIDMLSMILGEGDTSRLCRKLRLESPIVNYVGASSFTLKDPGLLLIAATLNPKNMKEFFAKLEETLESILSEEVTSEEMSRCKTLLESDEFYDIETVDGLNRKAGFLDYFLGDFRAYAKYLGKVNKIHPKDILKIARKYLDPKKLTITGMVKENEKQLLKDIKAWHEEYTKSYKAAIKVKSQKTKLQKNKGTKKIPSIGLKRDQPVIREHKLDNGVRAIFRISKDTPVLSVKLAAMGGLRSEENNLVGVSDLMSRTWCSGTNSKDENQINHITESMATKFSAFSGRNSSGLSMTLLSPFERESIELFSDVLSSPIFPETVVSREKEIVTESIRTQMDQPGYVVGQMFLQQMFKGHPYANDPQGTLETVRKIQREDIVNFYNKFRSEKESLVVISGHCSEDKWIVELNKSIGKWKKATTKKDFVLDPISEDKKVYKELEKEQSHIMVGVRGLTINSAKRYPMQLLQSILGGMGGRLFTELREKASLAYSVYPTNFEGLDTGYFGAYIGCSPEKGKRAIEMMLKEFQKISEQPPKEEELERAKKYLVGRHDIGLQRNSAFATSILFNEIYGIPLTEINEYKEKIFAVTKSEIQSLAQELFKQQFVYSAIGAVCPW